MSSIDARLSLRTSAPRCPRVARLRRNERRRLPQRELVRVGYRDARYKLQSQAEVYAAQCARHGVQIDAARYDQGLRQGRFDFPDRMT